jgi:hypothetical protein
VISVRLSAISLRLFVAYSETLEPCRKLIDFFDEEGVGEDAFAVTVE